MAKIPWVIVLPFTSSSAAWPGQRQYREETSQVLQRQGAFIDQVAASTSSQSGGIASDICGWLGGNPGMSIWTQILLWKNKFFLSIGHLQVSHGFARRQVLVLLILE